MARATPIIEALKDRVSEADKALGGLTDNHLKWIIVYVRQKFGAQHANFAINFNSTPKTIDVTPYKHDRITFGKLEWLKIRFMLWRSGDEQDMAAFLGLEGWVIKFSRLPKMLPVEEK